MQLIRAGQFARILMHTALAASLCANAALAYRSSHPPAAPPLPLSVGQRVPAVVLENVGRGTAESIDFGGSGTGTVLYFVAPDCRRCEDNLAAALALQQRVHQEFRFLPISVSAERLGEYLTRSQLTWRPLFMPEATRQRYALSGLPQTIVIDGSGMVRANWVGEYKGSLAEKIRAFVSVRS